MSTKTEQWPWIDFQEVPAPGRATHIWSVQSRRDGFELGQIRRFGRWRCYAFFPAPHTVFNTVCLRGIEQFIRAAMADRKPKREATHARP